MSRLPVTESGEDAFTRNWGRELRVEIEKTGRRSRDTDLPVCPARKGSRGPHQHPPEGETGLQLQDTDVEASRRCQPGRERVCKPPGVQSHREHGAVVEGVGDAHERQPQFLAAVVLIEPQQPRALPAPVRRRG